MATLLDIRRRIRSVKSTQQITRAMKMVAAARLRRAQDNIFKARPYANQMLTLLESLAARTEQRDHPLLAERPIEKVLLVLITADRGLCGAFNANLIRSAQNYLEGNAASKFRSSPWGARAGTFLAGSPSRWFRSTSTCSDVSSFRRPSRWPKRSSTSTHRKKWMRLTSSITNSNPL